VRFRVALSLLALALIAGGCLHDDENDETVTVRETVTETASGTVPSKAPAVVTLYFLRDGKVAPVARGVVAGPRIAATAMHELLETTEAGYATAIPPERELVSVDIDAEVALVRLDGPIADRRAQAQIVYTLTQFPTVKRVSLNGSAPVGRPAFEAQTPAVLVESPLPEEQVDSGFEVTGTANTFEATFNYELRNEAGRVVSKNFVTATSGSGTRGTFRFTVPYEIDEPQEGSLVVFEISAADGSRTNEVSIPLRLR
jgi:hypothetical protein